jgi:hypothetical protein
MKMHSLSFALLLTFGACAADAPDWDGGGGSGSGSNPEEPAPRTPEGRYALQSEFDLATNMPGTAGAIVNGFIAATDDPDDPTRWILDQLIAQLPDGSIKNFVSGSAPFVAGYLNDRLLQIAPQFVTRIVDVGNKFGSVARNFGTLDTLEVAANGSAKHVVHGVQFKVDELELQYMFKDYGSGDVEAAGLQVTLDPTGKLMISEHKIGLPYGTVLRIGLDEFVIPLVDPTAVTLHDVLKNVVNCQAVGQYVYEAVGIGSASTFHSACNAGLLAASALVYSQLTKLNESALEFGINGLAKAIDNNKDGKMDKIQTGAWSGTLSYAGTGAPLAKGQFHGVRL